MEKLTLKEFKERITIEQKVLKMYEDALYFLNTKDFQGEVNSYVQDNFFSVDVRTKNPEFAKKAFHLFEKGDETTSEEIYNIHFYIDFDLFDMDKAHYFIPAEKEARNIILSHYVVLFDSDSDKGEEVLVSMLAQKSAEITVKKIIEQVISIDNEQNKNDHELQLRLKFWLEVEKYIKESF